MPKLLGTDFLKGLSNAPKVIFVTAYRDYAVEGYELDVVDYLLKPVSFERFVKAITKVKQLLGHEAAALPATSMQPGEGFVYLKVDRRMQKFFVNEIVYIESWKDYVKIFLANGKWHLVKHSITAMENLLSQQHFIRVHRSYLVSLKKLTGYTHLCVQVGSQEIPIGRLYKQQLFEQIASK